MNETPFATPRNVNTSPNGPIQNKRIRLDSFANPETPPRTPSTLDSLLNMKPVYPFSYTSALMPESSNSSWFTPMSAENYFKNPMAFPNHKPQMFVSFWDEQKTNVLQLEHAGQLITKRLDNNMINGTKLLNLTVLNMS